MLLILSTLTLLGYVGHPGVRSHSQLLEGAVVCQGIYKNLVYEVIDNPRKEAHLNRLPLYKLCCGPEPQCWYTICLLTLPLY